jgi:hypothetical protein
VVLQVYDQSGWDLFSQTAVVGMCDLEHPAAQTPTNPPKSRKERERERERERRRRRKKIQSRVSHHNNPNSFLFSFSFGFVLFLDFKSNTKKIPEKKKHLFHFFCFFKSRDPEFIIADKD